MKRLKKCALWSIAAVFMTINPAFSQVSSTSLQGTVTDPSGSAIAGATVVLSNPESKTERSVTTDMAGEYRFLAVPPGTYVFSVTARGFAGYTQTGLHLLVNTPATSNVQLKIGATTESITVESEAPALNLSLIHI